MEPKILCLGDSITQQGWNVDVNGWVAQLSNAYLRRYDVLNRGFSGYNTRWTRTLLPRMLPTSLKAMRLITVFFGANDAQMAPYKQHVPLPEFVDNMRAIVDAFRSPDSPHYAPDALVVLIAPPPVGEKMWREDRAEKNMPFDRGNSRTKEYAQAVADLAAQLALPCVDMWTAIERRVELLRDMPYGGYEEFLRDGLHLNAKGNNLLAQLLLAAIEERAPQLKPENIQYVLPDHSNIQEGTIEEMQQYL
ncbi:isoamyl acetate-hydrolyzing esterase [Coemansia sp. RSA 1722]|nr:isoamyl acetate-hydrolyzing esterase [Coemansia sp. RSA 485]KAJ2604872.1 isoamyl acetate-hydrolyzing esterase [Coemansia sp. RSA 1722]